MCGGDIPGQHVQGRAWSEGRLCCRAHFLTTIATIQPLRRVQVYADWGAAKTHLAEDFVSGWWAYTRSANIPVKALPLIFVTE